MAFKTRWCPKLDRPCRTGEESDVVCAWYRVNQRECAILALPERLNALIETIEGYDQQGMLVRVTEV